MMAKIFHHKTSVKLTLLFLSKGPSHLFVWISHMLRYKHEKPQIQTNAGLWFFYLIAQWESGMGVQKLSVTMKGELISTQVKWSLLMKILEENQTSLGCFRGAMRPWERVEGAQACSHRTSAATWLSSRASRFLCSHSSLHIWCLPTKSYIILGLSFRCFLWDPQSDHQTERTSKEKKRQRARSLAMESTIQRDLAIVALELSHIPVRFAIGVASHELDMPYLGHELCQMFIFNIWTSFFFF